MSTPDETSQPLTRRRLRELKLTGQNPVITTEEIDAAKAAREAEEARTAAERDAAAATETEAAAPQTLEGEIVESEPQDDLPPVPSEPAPAEEVASLEAAAAESSAPPVYPVDASRPLTRREVREQERIRTSQLAVVQPTDETETAQDELPADEVEPHVAAIETKIVGENETSVLYEVVEVPFDHPEPAPTEADAAGEQAPVAFEQELPVAHLVYEEGAPEAEAPAPRPDDEFAHAPVDTVYVAEDAPQPDAESEERPTVAPAFGSSLLQAPSATPPAASFEEILSHSNDSSGSATASSALILATDPGSIPLSAPIDATGEILITSTHALPDGFGSRGHAAGTTDGKEVDVVLIDGELPLASSPTPIAASDAVSTSKSPAEVIRPPAPEKTHRLTLILGIAAGVLGVALIGVVVAAFMNGLLG